MKNTINPQISVSTMLRYSEGDTTGTWLSINDYEDYEALMEACNALFQGEEFCPSLLFVSWIDLPNCMVNETCINDEIYEYIETVEDFEESQTNAFNLFITHLSDWYGKTKTLQYFNASYQGY